MFPKFCDICHILHRSLVEMNVTDDKCIEEDFVDLADA